MIYKDPKAFIGKYFERFQKEMQDPHLLKAEIEEKLKYSDLSEREKLETQYFLYFIQKNLLGKPDTLKFRKYIEPFSPTPKKKLLGKQALLPERSSVNTFHRRSRGDKSNFATHKSQLFNDSTAEKHSELITANSENFGELKEINEKKQKNVRSEAQTVIHEVTESHKMYFNTKQRKNEQSLSPVKPSSGSFSLFGLKKVASQNEISFATDDPGSSARSGPVKRLEKLRKITVRKLPNNGQFENFPKLQKDYSLVSKHSESSSALDKVKKFGKKGPCRHVYHYSPITKLSILDDNKKSIIGAHCVPVVDPDKRMNLVMRSASLEKQKQFKDFQLVKLF